MDKSIRENNIKKALDNYIKNLEKDTYQKVFDYILNDTKLEKVIDIKKEVSSYLNLRCVNKFTREYWIKRGWSELDTEIKLNKLKSSINEKRISPFSKEYWINRGYSEEASIYKINSMRPTYKEYWLEKGFSEEESLKKAKEQHKINSLKGNLKSKQIPTSFRKIKSPRCKEFWISKGYTEEESIEKVKEIQNTFSKEKCIEKYGEEEGLKIWKKRQDKWIKSFNNSFTNYKLKSPVSMRVLKQYFNNDVNKYFEFLNESFRYKLKPTIEEFIELIKNDISKNLL